MQCYVFPVNCDQILRGASTSRLTQILWLLRAGVEFQRHYTPFNVSRELISLHNLNMAFTCADDWKGTDSLISIGH